MTLARIAAHLDPATEVDGFQTAARTVLAHPVVTEHYPNPGVLTLVRRFEEPLRNEFARICNWRLDVGPTCARLMRRPPAVSSHRPARTVSQSRRPFSPMTYASLCLVLASLESLGAQTSISQLAEESLRVRAGDDDLPLDLTRHTHRRAFVDAVAWLEARGILTLLDGDTEAFLSRDGDALYDIDADAASRLLVSPPNVLAGLSAPEQFLDEVYPPTLEGSHARARHRVHRRLLTETVLYYDELPEHERSYARQRRTRIREELERLTGCHLECRAEGQALIGLAESESWPGPSGTVPQAALLYGEELAAEARGAVTGADAAARLDGVIYTTREHDEPTGQPVGRVVDAAEAGRCWRRVVGAYQQRFAADYRAEPDRLLDEATDLLERLDLVTRRPDGSILVRPALARYRVDVRLPEVLDV